MKKSTEEEERLKKLQQEWKSKQEEENMCLVLCGWFGSRFVLRSCLVLGFCPIRLVMCHDYILTKCKVKMLHVAGHDATWTAIE